jgi:hypothetical protein
MKQALCYGHHVWVTTGNVDDKGRLEYRNENCGELMYRKVGSPK